MTKAGLSDSLTSLAKVWRARILGSIEADKDRYEDDIVRAVLRGLRWLSERLQVDSSTGTTATTLAMAPQP